MWKSCKSSDEVRTERWQDSRETERCWKMFTLEVENFSEKSVNIFHNNNITSRVEQLLYGYFFLSTAFLAAFQRSYPTPTHTIERFPIFFLLYFFFFSFSISRTAAAWLLPLPGRRRRRRLLFYNHFHLFTQLGCVWMFEMSIELSQRYFFFGWEKFFVYIFSMRYFRLNNLRQLSIIAIRTLILRFHCEVPSRAKDLK